jgi:hypothetical protein
MAVPRRPVRRPAHGLPIVRKNTVRLPGDVAHRIRAGHPWVYREALGPRPLVAEPGTVIDCVDEDGEFVGRGLYDGDSAIALRVFVRKPDIAIDGRLIRERVRAAIALRKKLIDLDKLGSARLVNAESDGLPGIVVERYADYHVIQLFTGAVLGLRDGLYDALEAELAPRAIAAPVRRWAGPISATGWLPRMMVIVSPRSTASSRSEKCRDASVAVMVFMKPFYLIIRFVTRPTAHAGVRRQRRTKHVVCRTLAGLIPDIGAGGGSHEQGERNSERCRRVGTGCVEHAIGTNSRKLEHASRAVGRQGCLASVRSSPSSQGSLSAPGVTRCNTTRPWQQRSNGPISCPRSALARSRRATAPWPFPCQAPPRRLPRQISSPVPAAISTSATSISAIR